MKHRELPMMRKNVCLALLATLALPAVADDYVSSFGFKFSLTSDWLVLTPGEVAKLFKRQSLAGVSSVLGDQENATAVLQRVKAGNVEFFFDRKHSTNDFKNNISVQLMPDGKPPNEAAARELCQAMPRQLPTVIGAPVKIRHCGLKRANAVPYMAYEYFVPSQGVSIVQHEIADLGGAVLVLVGGSNDQGLRNTRATQEALTAAITAHVNTRRAP